MRMLAFARRNTKEILGDPLNLAFGLGFPLVLLVLLLVVTMVFIYRGVQSMTVSDDFDSQIAIRRRITNGIINELNHAEIVGQTIAVGQVEKYSQYKKNMSNADVYIDSLRRMTDDTLQLARLDTVAMLMAQKDKNMR